MRTEGRKGDAKMGPIRRPIVACAIAALIVSPQIITSGVSAFVIRNGAGTSCTQSATNSDGCGSLSLPIRTSLHLSNNNDTEESSSDKEGVSSDPREELSPPVFSLTKKSILFDESSSDDEDAESLISPEMSKTAGSLTLAVWSGAKAVLPPILTGASKPDAGDKDALGSLYNLLFVRLPTFCVGVGYVFNLVHGHPLMMDPFGTGAFEVSPIVVFAALWAILRY